MSYVVVASWDGNNRITADAGVVDTEAEAIAKRDVLLSEGHTGAFYAEHPGGTLNELLVNNGSLVFDPPNTVRVADVKAEAQRRIIALWGASSFEDVVVKQLNANMRANELQEIRIEGGALTPEQAAEAVALKQSADDTKVIRAASNVIEAMNPIPSDYTNDSYWA